MVKADRKMETVLSTKSADRMTRIGFWNVRTMNKIGRFGQVTSEIRHYNLHILRFIESRWMGSGKDSELIQERQFKTQEEMTTNKIRQWPSSSGKVQGIA